MANDWDVSDAGAGQVVVQTSATGEKPQPSMVGCATKRAAANMMCRCAALTVAPSGVCVNAVGTNFMNYPGLLARLASDPAGLASSFAAVSVLISLCCAAKGAH